MMPNEFIVTPATPSVFTDGVGGDRSGGIEESNGTSQAAPTLHVAPRPVNVDGATPVKRTRKSMSRRTGQKGHIEQSGRWWVARWWMDVPGQERRALKRA
ncbi:MAG TPA: hypothetical protein VGO93_19595, partial [Candidatus Xenobia bacterium]